MEKPKKTKRSDRGAFIAIFVFGIVLSLTAPAPLVASGVISSIFCQRLSEYEETFNDSLESYLYKNAADYPSLNNYENIQFSSGDNTLQAYLFEDDDPRGVLVMAHGMGSMALGREAALADYFLSNDWDVFAFDLTASGKSEGNGAGGLDQSAADVVAALKCVHASSQMEGLDICLLGYSWGGYGVCAALKDDASPKAVASFSGFYSPSAEMIVKAEGVMGVLAPLSISVMDAGLYLNRGSKGFYSALDALNLRTETSVYLVQGGQDASVTPFASLYGKKDQISNPSRLKSSYFPERSHGNIFYSDDANAYYENTITPLLDSLFLDYSSWDKVPQTRRDELEGQIDLDRSSALDVDTLAAIEKTFEAAIAK